MSKDNKENVGIPVRGKLPNELKPPVKPVIGVRPGNANQQQAPEQAPLTPTVTETIPVSNMGDVRVRTAFDAAMSAIKDSKNGRDRIKAYLTIVNIVRSILRHEDRNQFRVEWTAFLNAAQAHASEFNELTAFQGMNDWNESRTIYNFYTGVMTLVFATRDPKQRFKLTSVRIDDIAATVNRLVPKSGQNLIGYYSA